MPEQRKNWTVVGHTPRVGRSSIKIDCPFCHGILTAYPWSFAGHGKKKCPCGAILYWAGHAIKREPNDAVSN